MSPPEAKIKKKKDVEKLEHSYFAGGNMTTI